MRALYGRVQRIFDEAGATNAVWVVDYSTHAGTAKHESVEATWPVHRDGYPNTEYQQARVDAVRACMRRTCVRPAGLGMDEWLSCC